METLVGGSETAHAQKEGGTSRANISEFVSKGEEMFVHMTNTLQEMSKHGKKLSTVVETVEKLQTDMKAMKRVHSEKEEGTLKKQKVGEISENEISDDEVETSSKNEHSGDIADIFSDTQFDSDREESDEDFLQELDNQFKEKVETGEKVSEKIAGFTNRGLRAEPQEQIMKELREKHKRPENLHNLQTPLVESFLWRDLKTNAKLIDGKLQKSVHQMSDCLVPVIKALDHVRTTKTVDRALMKELLSDTFNMMVYNITSTNKIRKEKIIQEVFPAYKNICQKSKTSATQLFGDSLKEDAKSVVEKTPQMTQSPRTTSFLGKRGGGHSNKSRNYRKPSSNGYGQQRASQPAYKYNKNQHHHKGSQNFQRKDQAHRK